MTSQGSAYARFRRALQTGSLPVVRAAAAELPTIRLDDALRVCVLIRENDPNHYERAALRWVGRFALEARDATLADVRAGAAALEQLPDEPATRWALCSVSASRTGSANRAIQASGA
jgi:hypothetical protein